MADRWLFTALAAAICTFMLVVVALALDTGETRAVTAPEIRVIDGDTIRFEGESYRLVDFDAPETGERARCAVEVRLGREAKDYLQALVSGSERVTLTRVPCACPRGTESTMACNYARLCGRLRVDGLDVGPLLIAQSLARPYRHTPGRPMPPADWGC